MSVIAGVVRVEQDNRPDPSVLTELFASARRAELVSLPAAEGERLLKLQFDGQTAQYRARYPHGLDHSIVFDGAVVGRMLVDHSADEAIVLVDIAVLESHRNRGIGSAAMRELCADADARRRAIRLRVWTLNAAARRWYARHGFAELGASGGHIDLIRTLEGTARTRDAHHCTDA